MYITTIQKWGNDVVLRIPDDILEKVNIKANDKVEIKILNRGLIITPVKKRKTLKERIDNYEGDYKCTEANFGESKGKEIF